MKTRIISAIMALVMVVPLFILGGYPFIIGASVVAILAYKELIDLKKAHKEIPPLIVVFGLVSMILLMLSNLNNLYINRGLTYQRLALVMLLLLVPTIFYKKDKYLTKDAFYMVGITYFIGILFNLLIVIRLRNLYLLLYLILIPILNDTFAYFGGYLFGKHKMCPSLSPKKTWEGALCGLLIGSVGGVILYSSLVDAFSFRILVLTIILSIIGQMGDLIMSKVKRENDIKDFSNIMPGHGGVLDRLDSITFVILTYVAIMFVI